MSADEILSQNDLSDLLKRIFESRLGLGIEPSASAHPLSSRAEDSYFAGVGFTGDWEGALLIECPGSTARFLASAMDGAPSAPAAVPGFAAGSNDAPLNLRETLGEIAWLTADELRGPLPGPASLHLPFVVEGSRCSVSIRNSHTVVAAPYTVGAHQILFTVLESESFEEPADVSADLSRDFPVASRILSDLFERI